MMGSSTPKGGLVPDELLEIEALATSPPPAEALDALFRGRSTDELAERRVRDDLRRQIGALERQLGELFASAFPRPGIEWGVGAIGGPRLLGIAELERVRDGLAARVRDVQAELRRRGEVEEANRGLLESMIADPSRYRWVRVSAEDVGEPICRHWHSRPRWGILGMLMGWWRVKLSSGCPLAEGRRPPEQQAQEAPRPPLAGRASGRDRGSARAGPGDACPPGGRRRRAAAGAVGLVSAR
jgi:hypothetical protein